MNLAQGGLILVRSTAVAIDGAADIRQTIVLCLSSPPAPPRWWRRPSLLRGHLRSSPLNRDFPPTQAARSMRPSRLLHASGPTLAPGFDMCFPARSPSPREGKRRFIKLGIIFLKREISHIPLRIRRTCRFAYCSWKFFRKTGQVRRLLHLSHNERAYRGHPGVAVQRCT